MFIPRWSSTMLLVLAGAATFAGPARAQETKLDAAALEGFRAREIGPAAMSGRISAIAGYVGERPTWFVGAAGGGLWKSRDGGITFKPIFDKYNLSIGAIAIAPGDTNTVWVGTGEPWTRNSVSVGDGVYRTTDGGENWQKLGLEATERISDLAIHPKNADVVLVGALGPLFSDGAERGVYRTTDGGKSWTKTLYVDASTGCADLAVNPANPEDVFAAMWTFRRKAWSFSSGGPGSGLYRSADGGATWKKVSGPWSTQLCGRIAVAFAPSDPKRVYAVVESKNTALWRSDDGGETWRSMNSGNAVGARPFYFCSIVVDPKNPDVVYKHGYGLAMSEDGGKTFGGGGNYHSDTHALWINPNDTDELVLGTDGGVYASDDRGAHWRLVGTLPVSQLYHVSTDMETPYNVYCGLQDNGSWTAPSRVPGGIGNRHWVNTGGGDGFWTFPDPKDADIVFCEYQGGMVLRFRKSTRETKEIKPFRAVDEPEYRWNWNTPIHPSPTQSGRLYLGAQFLFRSDDRGDHWTRISPDLTTNDPKKLKQIESGGVSVDNSSAENHCTIVTIGESPKDPNVVWAGTDDGNVQLTRDGGKTWTNVVKNVAGLPPATWASCVRPSAFDAATAYATFDGHYAGDLKTYVYVTRDFGKTWTPLATPDLKGYAHVVLEDIVNPKLLFVGTEFGLFCSIDGGTSWAQLKGNLPNVAVRDLVIQPREHDLVVATHGRGAFIFDDLTPLRALTPAVLEAEDAFLPARPAVLTIPASEQRFDGDDQFVGQTLQEVAPVYYYLKKRHVFGDLKVEILDEKGEVVSSLPGGKRRGLNRVDWSMRMRAPKVPPATNLVPQQYSFVGPRVPAGTYTARLVRGSSMRTAPLTLVPDPRSDYSAADRAEQGRVVRELYASLEHLTFLVDKLTKARDAAREAAKGLAPANALAKKLFAFADALEDQRRALVATREGGRLTGEEQMRERLTALYGAVNGYDGRPTGSQVAYMKVLTGELATATQVFDDYTAKQLPALNAELAKAGKGAIALVTREEWEKSR